MIHLIALYVITISQIVARRIPEVPAADLFAGNGLITYSYNILHDHEIIEMNCTTYNNCYELLCDFLSDPIYVVKVHAKQWDGNCDDLDSTDFRVMWADFDVYDGIIYNNSYKTKTNSDASKLLCVLGKNTSFTDIYYMNFDCEISQVQAHYCHLVDQNCLV